MIALSVETPASLAEAPAPSNEEVAARTFWVSFDANGGKGSMDAMEATSGAAVTLPNNRFKRSDYMFLGWGTEKNGALAYKNKQTVVFQEDSPSKLYALWTKKNYKVKFYANGGKGKMSTLSMVYGKAAKLPANQFERGGYLFIGWAQTKRAAAAGKVAYKDGKSVKNLVVSGKTAKLYAVWQPFIPKTPGLVRFALCQTPCGIYPASTRIDDTFDWVRNSLRGDEDVIVFPELAFVNFSELKTGWRKGKTVWKKAKAFAQERGAWVLVNHPNRPGGAGSKMFNETRVYAPDGRIAAVYRKRVLAEMDVKASFSPGPSPVMANLPFAKLGLLICKDAFMPSIQGTAYSKADILLAQFSHPGVVKRTKAERKWFHSPKKATAEVVGSRRDWKFLHKPFMAVNKSGPDGHYQLAGGAFASKVNGDLVASAGASPTVLFVDFPLRSNGRIQPIPAPSPDIPEPDLSADVSDPLPSSGDTVPDPSPIEAP